MIRVDRRAVWRVRVRGVERELDERLVAALTGEATRGDAGIAVRKTG